MSPFKKGGELFMSHFSKGGLRGIFLRGVYPCKTDDELRQHRGEVWILN